MMKYTIKRLVILILGLLVVQGIVAQKRLHVNPDNTCSFDGTLADDDLYTYSSESKMDVIVEEIVDVIGLDVNFELKVVNVPNAVAYVKGNKRMIMYSENFMHKLLADSGTRWAAYGLLAHEIAHHLNNHTLKVTGDRRLQELSADKFSGRVLRLLGATLEEAQAAVKQSKKYASHTHPSSSARLEAVTNGWNIGGGIVDRDKDGVPDSRDLCPGEYGTSRASGCPDADNDGIPNKDDNCPYEPGVVAKQGCPMNPDKDSDGVPDEFDKCPTQKGLARFEGCPDTDGDNIPDNVDKCPTKFGKASNDGCPVASSDTFTSYTETTTNPHFKMIAIKGGSFKMGNQDGDSDSNEIPVHSVNVPDFYLAEFEVTQMLWRNVMGSDPEDLYFKGKDNNPVEHVSWNDVQEFIKKLNLKSGKKYRLPSEAEWEYAARGGQKSNGHKYAGSNKLVDVAWYCENSRDLGTDHKNYGTNPVGEKDPNDLGLYDMSGNVWEWCQDKYYDDYKKAPKDGSAWTDGSSSNRVFRGGSWNSVATRCRVTSRSGHYTNARYEIIGFRLAVSL